MDKITYVYSMIVHINVKNTVRIWYSALEYLGETSKLSQFCPIFGND